MATTSKSPKRILRVAHAVGKQRLRTYWHKYSPKKFTLPQLFACLVLKEFLRLDYRKLSALLEDAPALAGAIGLKQVPHFSTFQKAAARLLVSRHVQQLLDETIEVAAQHRVMRKKVSLLNVTACLDANGHRSNDRSVLYVASEAVNVTGNDNRLVGIKAWSTLTSQYGSTSYPLPERINKICNCFQLHAFTALGCKRTDVRRQNDLRITGQWTCIWLGVKHIQPRAGYSFFI